MKLPTGVAVDAGGNIYIADNQNSALRKVDSSGTITTIVSTSTSDVIMPFFPEDVAVDSAGHVYVADFNNMRVFELR